MSVIYRVVGKAIMPPRHLKVPQRFKSALAAMAEEFPGTPVVQASIPSPPSFKSSTSPSGMKIGALSTGSGAATLSLTVLAGSRSETACQRGASHLLQHLGFKTTSSRSALRLMRDLENVGATVSSVSSREFITYEVCVLKDHVEPAFAALAESVVSGRFPAWEVSEVKEQSVAADLASYASNPFLLLTDLIHEASFGESSGLGGSVYSNAELGFEDLLNFRASHFVTGNFVLTGAGVDHDVLASLASCYLSKAVEAPSVPYPASAFKGGEARLKASGLSAHVALAFKSGALGKNDAADVLAAVLNARLSSAHGGSCGAFSTAYSDVGLTGVYGMGDVTTIVDTLASTMKTIAAGLTAKEFEVAKTKVALSRALELESNEGTTGLTIAKAVAARLDPTAYALAPKKLTDQEVVECAKEALKAGLAYAALGPVGQLPRYDAVCKMLSV